MSCSSSDSQLQVTGCMPVTLIKRSVLSLDDEYVSGCLTESARCRAQMPREHSVTRQEMGHACGSPSEAFLSGMSMEFTVHEGSAGQDFRCLQHCLYFFCINSEEKLIPLINAECRVHPSISSFSLSPISVFLLISATTKNLRDMGMIL